MKKKLLLFAILVLGTSFVDAKSTENDAIFVWVDGSSICYQLSAMPKVTYEDNAAVLFINGIETLRLTLTDSKQLKITYGVYSTTSIDGENINLKRVNQVGKYIMGGKLIIANGGILFDAQGNQIK